MRPNSTIINILKVFATLLVFLCHSTIVAKECFGGGGLIRIFNTPAWGGMDVLDNQWVIGFLWV